MASEPSATTTPNFVDTIKMFFSRPELLFAALGSGATQFITYGVGNFTTLFLMREKGMTLGQVAIYYALVVAIAMSTKMSLVVMYILWMVNIHLEGEGKVEIATAKFLTLILVRKLFRTCIFASG